MAIIKMKFNETQNFSHLQATTAANLTHRNAILCYSPTDRCFYIYQLKIYDDDENTTTFKCISTIKALSPSIPTTLNLPSSTQAYALTSESCNYFVGLTQRSGWKCDLSKVAPLERTARRRDPIDLSKAAPLERIERHRDPTDL